MHTGRVDLYTRIHKAIRRSLFETTIAVARIDFSSPDGLADAQAFLARCFGFLREHAEHEDRHTMVALARVAPLLAADLESEHVALEKATVAIELLLSRMAASPPEARTQLATELLRSIYALVRDQLGHLDREEREANGALWTALTDDELMALEGAIVASVPAPRMAEWMELWLPTLSAPERAAMGVAA